MATDRSSLNILCGWSMCFSTSRRAIHAPRREEMVQAQAPVEDADDNSRVEGWEMECVRQVQGGRPEHFDPLVRHYAPRIRAYVQRMVRDREEAEDVTQETFLKAYRALPRFDAGRPFKPWIFAIATNTALNAIRSRQRRGVQLELDPALPAHREATATSGDRAERLERALAELAPRAGQLITLHYHEGLSLKESGAILGMSEGAAKAALCRARQELRERMKQDDRA